VPPVVDTSGDEWYDGTETEINERLVMLGTQHNKTTSPIKGISFYGQERRAVAHGPFCGCCMTIVATFWRYGPPMGKCSLRMVGRLCNSPGSLARRNLTKKEG
jgi:hypothetical protein